MLYCRSCNRFFRAKVSMEESYLDTEGKYHPVADVIDTDIDPEWPEE